MRFKTLLVMVVLLLSGVIGLIAVRAYAGEGPKININSLRDIQVLPGVMNNIKTPLIDNPDWLDAEIAAAAAASKRVIASPSTSSTVYYSVAAKGVITSDLDEFKAQANQTLNDGRGWARMGVSFQEVASGGSFVLVLSEASQVTSFSSACSVYYSCRVGINIIINQDRWSGASDSWNQAGGSLRDYRHMVINHETGHWLGHGHLDCSGAGQPAPLMQQQSINLQGCSFNPWPLDSELWSSQLGIGL